ncbi:MAG: winged helix-turn-helix domain-containing protein [Clostridiales bacterium]
MKTSKLKRVVIKEEFVAITGNVITALLLNQMIYWSERIRDFDKFIEEEKKRVEMEGQDVKIAIQNGWIYKSYDELKEELMLTDSIKTISRHVNKLVEMGFLDRRRNPKFRYDRKYQYRVNLLTIINSLSEMGYNLQGYRVEFSKGQNDNCNCQTDGIEMNICPSNCQNDNSKRQIDNSKGQIDNSKGQNDNSNCQIDKAIPEITTEIIPETIIKASTTMKIDDELNTNSNHHLTMIVKSIESKYSNITGKNMNSDDIETLLEVLDYPIRNHIDITTKESLIVNTVTHVYKKYKLKNPNKDINSFKYYFNAIKDEFKKLDKSRGEKLNEYKSERNSVRDFTKLYTNR